MNENQKPLNWVIGLAAMGGSVAGVVSFLAGLLALLRGELTAAGVCFAAAGLTYGLLANAVLRR